MTIEDVQTELPFRVTSDAWVGLPKMPESEYPGTEGFIGDVYSNPDDSVMCSGFFDFTTPMSLCATSMTTTR